MRSERSRKNMKLTSGKLESRKKSECWKKRERNKGLKILRKVNIQDACTTETNKQEIKGARR